MANGGSSSGAAAFLRSSLWGEWPTQAVRLPGSTSTDGTRGHSSRTAAACHLDRCLSGPASERLQIVHDRFKLDLWETLGDGGAHLLRCVGI